VGYSEWQAFSLGRLPSLPCNLNDDVIAKAADPVCELGRDGEDEAGEVVQPAAALPIVLAPA